MAVAIPGKNLGQSLDKRLEKNRNGLWKKKVWCLINKIFSQNHVIQIFFSKFFICLKVCCKNLDWNCDT